MSTHDERMVRLNQLLDEGLDLGDCLNALAAREPPASLALIERARQELAFSEEFNIDSNALASVDGDATEGYVLGWYWCGSEEEDDDGT